MHLSSAKIMLPSKLCFILIISVLLGICYTLILPEDELSNSNSRARKLFFLILGYDRFLNGRVWNLFFKDVESEKYHVLMHVKNLRKYHPNSFEQKITLVDQKWTEYCKITNASNELVDAALSMSNSDDDVFFLISADTIPVKSFNELFQIFSNPGFKSRLCYCPTDQWKMIKENIYLPKVQSWFVFNKEDARKINAAAKKFPSFYDIFSPYRDEVAKEDICWEEFYYPIAIVKSTLGGLFDVSQNTKEWGLDFPSKNMQGSCALYVWWPDYADNSPFLADGIPRLTERETNGYQLIFINSENLLRKLKNSSFLFMRKVRDESKIFFAGKGYDSYVELTNGTHVSLFDAVKYIGLYDTPLGLNGASVFSPPKSEKGYLVNSKGEEIHLIFAYSSGSVGTASLSNKLMYCSPNAPMQMCKSRYSAIDFALEKNPLMFDNYCEWSEEVIESWVYNEYIPGIIRELNKNDKSIYFDTGHHNLYFIEPLLKYLAENSIKHTLIRLRRRRVESALSMMHIWNVMTPIDAPATKRFKYMPFTGKSNRTIMRVPLDEYSKFSMFQRALWEVDEVEMRWLELKNKYENLNVVEIYWESHVRNSVYTFQQAALKIANILGFHRGQFDINHVRIKDRVHISAALVPGVRSKYGLKGWWSHESDQYQNIMSASTNLSAKLPIVNIDWKWPYLPKSYTSFEYFN